MGRDRMDRRLVLAYAAVFALFLAAWIDAICSASVDLSHHYALVFRLFDEWSLSDPNDPSLWEMSIYPNLSHKLAAAIGWIVGSPLLGLQVVTWLSLALVWFACVWLLRTLPSRAATIGLAAFVLLLAVNRFVLHLPVHGAEIVQNFFFAQLVVQAAVLLAVAGAARMETRGAPIQARLLLLAAAVVCPAIHLLGALELLAVFALVLLTGFLASEYQEPHRRSRIALAAIALLAAAAAVVANPYFAAMRQISTNNGGGSLGPALSALSTSVVKTVLVLAVAALVVAFLLLRAWMQRGCSREHAVARYLFAYGAGLAGLALLQAAVLPFGAGSPYAVQKYAYGLITFLVLGLAALAGLQAERHSATDWRVPAGRWPTIASVAGLAAFCASLLLVEATKLLDVSDLVGLEQRIRVLRDTVLPVPTPERSNAVLLGRRIPQSVEYMFTIGILKTPRAKLGDMISYDRLGDATQFGSVIAGGEALTHVDAHCAHVIPAGRLVVVDASCVH